MTTSKKLVAKLEERLLEERQSALELLRRATAEESEPQSVSSGDVSRYPGHIGDLGSETQEEESDFMLAALESERLTRIDDALRLLRDDPERYLSCERGAHPIEVERLLIVPWTRLCSKHARETEDEQG